MGVPTKALKDKMKANGFDFQDCSLSIEWTVFQKKIEGGKATANVVGINRIDAETSTASLGLLLASLAKSDSRFKDALEMAMKEMSNGIIVEK